MKKPFRRGLYNKVWLTVEPALPPDGLTAEGLREVVHGIWSRHPQHP